jgi:anti-sigma regulatory factor (Ser/Thr protein kinase)
VREPLTLTVSARSDLVAARTKLQALARSIGFSSLAQVQIVTAASEILRNAVMYAGEGTVHARPSPRGIRIEVFDRGPGISLAVLAELNAGTYASPTGMGKGIAGSRKLMDRFSLMSTPGNTQILMEKHLQLGRP